MPEYIRALIVILVLATVVFAFAKTPATALAISKADFVNRRNTWFLITLAGFLSQNYWVFVAILVLIVYSAGKKDSNRVALFFFIVLALPQLNVEIPGFAGIRYLLSINYIKIITLILLFPLCVVARKDAIKNKSKGFITDKILLAYILLNLLLQAQYDSATGLIRSIVGWSVDVVIPYYAISRSIKNLKDFLDVLMSFIIAGLVVSAVAIVEFLRSWLLYGAVADALGVSWAAGYLDRGGLLRALSTSSQPIILGCVIAVVLALYSTLPNADKRDKKYYLGLALLFGGLVAPLSKGPWVGAAVMGIVILLTGTNRISSLIKIGCAVLVFGLAVAPTEFGQKLIAFLPFVGALDVGSATYRQQLFDTSLQIILDNPLLGSTDYLLHMENLRQGQGIIDLVNTYLIVALNTGLVGLCLYCSVFASVLFKILMQLREFNRAGESYLVGRALLAALIGLLVIIGTVSPIAHVPLLLWSLAAFGLAYSQLPKEVTLN
jgi:O-Antigen ligase